MFCVKCPERSGMFIESERGRICLNCYAADHNEGLNKTKNSQVNKTKIRKHKESQDDICQSIY